jgi:hypothetical protein
VADITGLLDLSEWSEKIPAFGSSPRTSPCTPNYTKRASDRQKAGSPRYELIAVNAMSTGQVAWLDARRYAHVHAPAWFAVLFPAVVAIAHSKNPA